MIPRPRLLAIAPWVLYAGVAAASVMVRPALPGPDGTVSRVAIAADCRVHVLAEGNDETQHPCGVPLSLPAGAGTLWIEQGDAISGQVALPLDAAAADLPLVPAGNVTVTRDAKPKRGERVRVIHAGATRFTREFPAEHPAQNVRVPAGAAVALYLDESGDVTGVAAGRAMSVRNPALLHADAPAHGAAVVGLFHVAEVVERAEKNEPATERFGFLLNPDRPAEILVDLGSEIVAIWRGLDAGPAELTLRSSAYQLAAHPLRLAERRIATVRGELRPLPDLTVTVDIPQESMAVWQALEPTITVRRVADRKTVRQMPATARQEFPLLPLDAYEVVLNSKPWAFVRRADLSSGEDATAEFFLKPFTIEGRVTAGNEPAAASITFRRSGGDTETVHTSEEGYYSITLWAGGMYLVETTLDDDASPPFSKLFRLSASRELDIRVPRTAVVVSVTDAATGEPVPNAEVVTFNAWDDPVTGRSRGSHTTVTDSSGRARLAPMNPGSAEIDVTAAGYFKDAPTTIPIDENAPERVVEINLRATGSGTAVRIVLPNGAPAANAELRAVTDPSGDRILWSGRADELGQIKVPGSLEGSIVLVRHEAAAGFARRFQNVDGQEYRLAPVSPQPLMVQVERHGAPAKHGAITVWFQGIPLSWGALQFLIRGPASVSANGSWTARNLPAGPVRLLASSGAIAAGIAAGAYDAVATTVPDPRPNRIVLVAVD